MLLSWTHLACVFCPWIRSSPLHVHGLTRRARKWLGSQIVLLFPAIVGGHFFELQRRLLFRVLWIPRLILHCSGSSFVYWQMQSGEVHLSLWMLWPQCFKGG